MQIISSVQVLRVIDYETKILDLGELATYKDYVLGNWCIRGLVLEVNGALTTYLSVDTVEKYLLDELS